MAVVTSVETGVGASTVAHSLNLSALNSGKISVLIQAEADSATSRREARKNAGTKERTSRTSLRSVNLLLSNRNSAQASDDIRADFELIVIDAPPVHQQPDVASLAAMADIVILVARDGATDRSAIEKARALLAKSGPTEEARHLFFADQDLKRCRNSEPEDERPERGPKHGRCVIDSHPNRVHLQLFARGGVKS